MTAERGSSLRVLCVGDLVGRFGRKMLIKHLPLLQEEFGTDVTIVNVENSAAGFGITDKIIQQLAGLKIDVMTSGNHVFDKRDIMRSIEGHSKLIRPANMHATAPGSGYKIVDLGDVKVAVINLMGRLFMPHLLDSPFEWADHLLEEILPITPIIIVDFHAETTAEKYVLGHYLSERVSAVYGTHTHTQTADERILNDHTAYISDLGMTGAYDSILGMATHLSMEKFITQLPVKLEPPDKSDEQILCGAIIDIDRATGRALAIERVQRRDCL